MKIFYICCLVLLAASSEFSCCCFALLATRNESLPPSVMLITVDNIEFYDLSELSTSKIIPTLNELSNEGIVLDSFYANSICTPSRNSLMSGKYKSQDLLQGQCLGNKLQAVGYHAFAVGTWHLDVEYNTPINQGFEEYSGYMLDYDHGTMEASSIKSKWFDTDQDYHHNSHFSENRHTSELYTDVALSKLNRGDHKQPFFLYISFQVFTNTPMKVPSKYIDGSIDNGCVAVESGDRKSMCGMLNQLDDSVSSLLKLLKSTNQWENTIFIFMSSNSNVVEKRGIFQEKSDLFRIPAFISGGFVSKNMQAFNTKPYHCNSLVHIADLHPTILSAVMSGDILSIKDSPVIEDVDGIDQWRYLISGCDAKHLYINQFRTNHLEDDGSDPLRSYFQGRKANSRLLTSSMSSASSSLGQLIARQLTILSDYDILSKFYGDTNGAGWTTSINWLNGSDPCPSGGWYGVTCNGADIVSLSLSANNLQGSLPSQLGLLTLMSSYFYLPSNSLTGLIPSELGQMSRMTTEFNLWLNYLTGHIPSELGRMTYMVSHFNVYENDLNGPIPSELGQMTKLAGGFYLHNNQLTGSIPSELGQFTNMLQQFALTTNSLTGKIPSEFGLLSKMIGNFHLNVNSLTGSIPSELGLMTKMSTFLNLYLNSLSGFLPSQLGSIPSELGQMSLLKAEFALSDNKLTGTIPSELGLMTGNTRGFYLHRNSLTGSIPSQLGQMTVMTNLFYLSTNKLCGNHIPSEVAALSSQITSDYDITTGNICTYEVLSKLYTDTQGSSWNFNTDWMRNINENPCSSGGWYGVTCSGSDIVSLSLHGNNLQGSLPTELGLLTALSSYLYLHSNSISGTIPSELGMMTSMSSYFGLHANSLTGFIPSQLGQLTAMTSIFYLATNSLDGSIPSQFGLLTRMEEEFALPRNMLSGPIPSEMGGMTLMKSGFHLDTNSLTGTLPSELGRMTGLTVSLYLAFNSIMGSIPSEFGMLTKFAGNFYLNTNALTGSIPSQLGMLNMFFSFYLHKNSLTGEIPSQLGLLTKITSSFFLSSNKLTGSVPSQLGQMTKITSSFYLNSNQLCGEVPYEVSALSLQVSGFDISSDNSIGTPCCESLPLVYTCSPTLAPTLFPTPIPTPLPSSLPTTLPSPVPTITCVSGTYLDGLSCVDCTIGRYSSFIGAPFPTSCNLCQAGKYGTSVAAIECINCATGKLSAPDRTYCGDCQAGEYSQNNTECVECEYGKYAPQALSDSCLTCAAGSHTNNVSKATLCSPCNAGTYSNKSSVNCLDCDIGQYSFSGVSLCTSCSKGAFTSQRASSSCTACSAGKFASIIGSWNCTSCSKGKYQGSTEQSQCSDCTAGSYAQSIGLSSCTSCEVGRTSDNGADSCNLASYEYYLSNVDDDVSFCPNHATCPGRYFVPIPDEGYWTDRTKYKFAGNIYRCPRDTCIASEINSTCWKNGIFNISISSKEECNFDQIKCREGSGGVLCGACLAGYIYQGVTNKCKECARAQFTSYISIGCLSFVGLVIFVYFKFGKHYSLNKFMPIHYLLSFDSGSLKVLWVTYQIIVSSSFTLGIEYPSPFNTMLGVLSIFSLDFLSLECLNDSSDDVYYITVYIWCLIPIFLAIVIILIGSLRVSKLPITEQRVVDFKRIMNQHVWLLLFLSYLVLPPVSSKQLQAFDCITLDSNERYLRSDTSIDCNSADYSEFKLVIGMFVTMYQLIPITWMVLLYQNKDALNPHTSNHDEKLATFIRDNNVNLSHLRFLFVDYKCNKWWFEMADMYRRIIFIGIVPLISPRSSTRASFGCILAILSVVYFREEQPYREEFTNVIAYVAQFCILVTFYGAMTIETTSMISFGLHGISLGVFLFLINLIISALCFWFAWQNFIKERQHKEIKETKASANENAQGFSQNKFNTTFESIWNHSVPSSHALVFYYTSVEHALICRKSGIPAQQTFNGVPLTLRHPHETTSSDFDVFDTIESMNSEVEKVVREYPNEEVLVLSLPRRFLEPLPGYEHDNGLCMISANILCALRSTSFTAVVDSKPWLDGLVLLSPQCVLRSFLILEPNSNTLSQGIKGRKSSNIYELLSPRLSRNASLSKSREVSSISNTFSSQRLIQDIPLMKTTVEITRISSVDKYIKLMSQIRQKAFERKLVPLYHYTNLFVAKLILKSGLRMSTQGQGDGGVYFSTQGPASYGLGTSEYEINIIKDCFGVERVDEYLGKGILDIVIVYGCEPSVLIQAPGGRDNAKMISKSTFKEFSLEHQNGNQFLRPDRILGAFCTEKSRKVVSKSVSKFNFKMASEMLVEMKRDKQSIQKLEMAEDRHVSNMARINQAVDAIWKRGESSEVTNEDSSKNFNIEDKYDDEIDGVVNSNVVLKRLSWLHPTPTKSVESDDVEEVIEMAHFGGTTDNGDQYHQNPLGIHNVADGRLRRSTDMDDDSHVTEI